MSNKSGKIWGSEQIAMNITIYCDELPVEILPAYCNWDLHVVNDGKLFQAAKPRKWRQVSQSPGFQSNFEGHKQLQWEKHQAEGP